MEDISINELKDKKESFIKEIRWDVTPKLFMGQGTSSGRNQDGAPRNIDGYMLYVDAGDEKPALVIMKNRFTISRTVGIIKDAPEELLLDSVKCGEAESVAGMYPLSPKLEAWLKKEFGIP
ncbi:MAG: hypothetical protein HY809_06125 [Nitrospirae bacterium]|nr:hypothetical protein [Nitrospirota bacterium]